jgi:hypothetical protein
VKYNGKLISGAQGCEYEDNSLLGYSAVQSRGSRPSFRGAYCLHHHGDESIVLMMEAVATTRLYIPEGYHPHTTRCENLKSHSLKIYFNAILSLRKALPFGFLVQNIASTFISLHMWQATCLAHLIVLYLANHSNSRRNVQITKILISFSNYISLRSKYIPQ